MSFKADIFSFGIISLFFAPMIPLDIYGRNSRTASGLQEWAEKI